MDRSFLLVLCLVTLSNVQLGQSQCDGKGIDNTWHHNKIVFAAVVRIAAAVYEAIGPALETMQKDMKNMKSDMASLSQKVGNLTEEVNSKLADVQRGLESKLVSVNDSLNDSFHNLFDLTTSELAIMNSSMRCVKTELSRVNEIMSVLGGHLQTHSQQTIHLNLTPD